MSRDRRNSSTRTYDPARLTPNLAATLVIVSVPLECPANRVTNFHKVHVQGRPTSNGTVVH